MLNSVNLDPTATKNARTSRDWLVDQIQALHLSDKEFPLPYEEKDNFFGSFHRRTKIRPLDDIDLISCLHATGCTYSTSGTQVILVVPETSARLKPLCHDGTNHLNSRKVINKFVSALSKIPQYRRAEIVRDGEAANLSLNSYDWSFDIVPSFFTSKDSSGKDFYLIPDGKAHWKKTDPRIDQELITSLNQSNDGNLLPGVRAAKFWYRYAIGSAMPSYTFEALIVNQCKIGLFRPSSYIDITLRSFLNRLAYAIYEPIPDPKGIQGDLNSLNVVERMAVSQKASADAQLIDDALKAERENDNKAAFAKLRLVLGDLFPAYA